jgi:hypothetical protein
MFTAYLLTHSGLDNASRELSDVQAREFRARLDLTLAKGTRDDLSLAARGGFAVAWSEGARSCHLVCRKGLVAIFDETGTTSLFRDAGDIAGLISECLRDEIAKADVPLVWARFAP